MISKKRVMVTGAGGFIGSSLVSKLIDEGATVAALDLSIGKLKLIKKKGLFAFFKCNLEDAETVNKTLLSFKPEVVVHLASHPDKKESFEQINSTVDSNIKATVNLLEAFRLCAGTLFIFGDSCKVYGNSGIPYREKMPMNPTSSYAITKVAGWQLCQMYSRLYNMITVSVRPSLIYGPMQPYNLITFVAESALQKKDTIKLDGGSQTRDPLYIDDALNVYIKVMEVGKKISGRVINIGGGHEYSVKEISSIVSKIMKSNIVIETSDENIRKTEISRCFCDNLEASELLGWQPAVNLEDGIRKTVQYLTNLGK